MAGGGAILPAWIRAAIARLKDNRDRDWAGAFLWESLGCARCDSFHGVSWHGFAVH